MPLCCQLYAKRYSDLLTTTRGLSSVGFLQPLPVPAARVGDFKSLILLLRLKGHRSSQSDLHPQGAGPESCRGDVAQRTRSPISVEF